MTIIFSEKKLHKIGRIDQVVRDYFELNPSVTEIAAKDLMKVFIEKGIFLKDHRNGFPIRSLLRELDTAGKMAFIKHCKVVRKDINRNWYFEKL